MPVIHFQGRAFYQLADETVLECLLRQGESVACACRSGVCQTCLMRADSPDGLPAMAQQGLKEGQRLRGYFLPCICRGNDDLTIIESDRDNYCRVTVTSKSHLSPTVVRLQLQPQQEFPFRAGQFVRVRRPDGVERSYSLSSLPGDGPLELHVRQVPGGEMSGWIAGTLQVGDAVEISEACGECCYSADDRMQPLLLVATGTGLAPLLGVVRDALAQHHQGPIKLFHGAASQQDLYLLDELKALQARAANVDYFPCVSDGVSADGEFRQGRVGDVALNELPTLQGWRVYLSGNPAMVQEMKMKAYLAGASLQHIHADPFVSASRPM
ncbi:MAG: hypothetical protein HY940_08095 [Gammaproteobacteria bacterium]|nr:hypothetical protein [Gammaproteobacteria bacterium]